MPIAPSPRRGRTAARLLAANGDRGSVGAVDVDAVRVTVTVSITTSGRTVTASATATAHFGFDAADE